MNSRYFPPTAEELEQIRANDRETINAFYLRNYDLIEETARGYLLRKAGRFTVSGVQELCNEAYMQLTFCDLSCLSHFVVSLRDCFFYFYRGGRDYWFHCKSYWYRHRNNLPDGIASLDAPTTANANGESEAGAPMVELLPFRPQRSEKKERQYRYILQLARELLAPKTFEVFRLRLTTDLTNEEIGRELGRKKPCVDHQGRNAWLKLIVNYEYVLTFLMQHGSTSAAYYIERGIVPEEYEYAVAHFIHLNEVSRINLRRYRAERKKRAQAPKI